MVRFYGISTFVGYLMPNPLHTNILNIWDLVLNHNFNILIYIFARVVYIFTIFNFISPQIFPNLLKFFVEKNSDSVINIFFYFVCLAFLFFYAGLWMILLHW